MNEGGQWLRVVAGHHTVISAYDKTCFYNEVKKGIRGRV